LRYPSFGLANWSCAPMAKDQGREGGVFKLIICICFYGTVVD
jgi:hypothetical protein